LYYKIQKPFRYAIKSSAECLQVYVKTKEKSENNRNLFEAKSTSAPSRSCSTHPSQRRFVTVGMLEFKVLKSKRSSKPRHMAGNIEQLNCCSERLRILKVEQWVQERI